MQTMDMTSQLQLGFLQLHTKCQHTIYIFVHIIQTKLHLMQQSLRESTLLTPDKNSLAGSHRNSKQWLHKSGSSTPKHAYVHNGNILPIYTLLFCSKSNNKEIFIFQHLSGLLERTVTGPKQYLLVVAWHTEISYGRNTGLKQNFSKKT